MYNCLCTDNNFPRFLIFTVGSRASSQSDVDVIDLNPIQISLDFKFLFNKLNHNHYLCSPNRHKQEKVRQKKKKSMQKSYLLSFLGSVMEEQ